MRLEIYLLCFYFIALESHRSLANSSDFNQCDQCCLSTFNPLLNYIPELKNKIDNIEDHKLTMEIKLDSQYFGFLERLELHEKLIRESLETIPTIKDFEDMRSEIKSLKNSPQVPIFETNKKSIPKNFQLIGSRYFYIEKKSTRSWNGAAVSCLRKGGYLAAFTNREELRAVANKLVKNEGYWIGINDEDSKGEYISLASRKEAPLLNFARNYPNGRGNFLYLLNGYFYNSYEYNKKFFICQSDREV